MTIRLPRLVAVLTCLYLAAMGFMIGIAVERVRFGTERAAVLHRLTRAEQGVRARLVDLEGRARSAVTARVPEAADRGGSPAEPGS